MSFQKENALEKSNGKPVKRRRLQEVVSLQGRLSHESNLKDIGKTFQVLIEGNSKKSDNDWTGRTSQNKSIVFPKENYDLKKGDYVNVKVLECTRATLIGKIANSTESRKEKAEII